VLVVIHPWPHCQLRYRLDLAESPDEDAGVPDADIIRPTVDDDHDSILALVRLAFSHAHRDGQEEVGIVVNTWARGNSVSPIDLVALDAGTVVGHVLGARGNLGQLGVMAVAPLAVTPARQGRGIGSNLMRELLRRADEAGWPMAVLLGSPEYYGRFGFEPSGPLGVIHPPVGEGNPHFQARRLKSYGASCRGEFTYCWENVG
jgi:putative acetyltransferase